jgi:N6-adenosine-specific RNA methylase IME4
VKIKICVSKATGKTKEFAFFEPFVTGIVDPPWPYTVAPGKAKKIDRKGKGNLSGYIQNKDVEQNQYAILSIDKLKKLPVGRLIGGYLFLWCVSPFIPAGLDLIKAWGFNYITTLCWAKYNLARVRAGGEQGGYGGVGFWFLGNHELVLVAKKPGAPSIRTGMSSLFIEPKGRHSAKPTKVFELCERLFPGPYTSVFERKREDVDRSKWHFFGNGVDNLPGEKESGPDIFEELPAFLKDYDERLAEK